MPICQKCKKEFPNRVEIDGKWKVLNRRKYCLDCSPFGVHNTKKLSGELRKDQMDEFKNPYKCRRCGEDDPDKFYGKRRSICGKCHNKETIDRYRERKKKAIEYKGGKCSVCGYNKFSGALEFHHINPEEKDINFSNMRFWSWERMKDEIDKCILVCANCHREIHGELIEDNCA